MRDNKIIGSRVGPMFCVFAKDAHGILDLKSTHVEHEDATAAAKEHARNGGMIMYCPDGYSLRRYVTSILNSINGTLSIIPPAGIRFLVMAAPSIVNDVPTKLTLKGQYTMDSGEVVKEQSAVVTKDISEAAKASFDSGEESVLIVEANRSAYLLYGDGKRADLGEFVELPADRIDPHTDHSYDPITGKYWVVTG